MPWLKPRYNKRVAGSERTITNEGHVIPTNSPYVVALDEIPYKATPTTVTISGKSEVRNTSPANDQFYVCYDGIDGGDPYPKGYLIFNESDKTETVLVSYQGTGSLQDGEKDLGAICTAFEKMQKELVGEMIVRGCEAFIPVWRFPARNAKATISGTNTFQTPSVPPTPTIDAGGFLRLDANAAYVEFTFIGTGVRLNFAKMTTGGNATILIDGSSPAQNATIDTYASPNAGPVSVEWTGLSRASHTIRVTRAGTKNGSSSNYYIYIDSFDVLIYGAGFTKAYIIPETVEYHAQDAGLTLTGFGTTGTWPFSRNGRSRSSPTLNDAITLSFTGVGAAAWVQVDNDQGLCEVYVDDVLYTYIDCYSNKSDYTKAWPIVVVGLTNAAHTLKILVKGTKAAPSSANTITVTGFSVFKEAENPEANKSSYSGIALCAGKRTELMTSATVTPGAADASNPRVDMVSIDSTASVNLNAGTAAAVPVLSFAVADSAAIAAIWVPASGTVSIYRADLYPTDRRLGPGFGGAGTMVCIADTSAANAFGATGSFRTKRMGNLLAFGVTWAAGGGAGTYYVYVNGVLIATGTIDDTNGTTVTALVDLRYLGDTVQQVDLNAVSQVGSGKFNFVAFSS